MSDAVCPKCGRQVPSLSPGGLCPKCLLALGLLSGDAPDDAATSPYSPAPSFTPPSAEELNKLFPLIEVVSLVGQGGMGAVYRGRQKKLDRQVAIKILPPEIGRDPAFAERFTREARALARLSHPNIVTIHDVGQAGEFYYIMMEYVDGANLRELIRGGEIEPPQALAIVQQVCDALAYAHSIGVVHRDIKPENILVDRAGKVKIADFGLAKLVGNEAQNVSLTGSADIMGTWRYMAPEQLEGSRDVDHRADIYSLGVVFYELLTGEVPMGRFRPPSEKVQVDVRIDEVVLKSLERERERRYQHASQVNEAISVSRGLPPTRSPDPVSMLLPQRMAAAIALIVGVISVGCGIAFVAAAIFSDPGSWQFWVYLAGALMVGGTGIWLVYNSSRQIRLDSASNDCAPAADRPLTIPRVLLMALGMVGGLILSGVGVALMPAAFRLAVPGSGVFWSWMGGAMACFFVGLANLAAAWTSYRRISGRGDWTKALGWTAYDRALVLYGMLGVAVTAVLCSFAWSGVFGPIESPRANAVVEASFLLGLTMLLQAILGLLLRAPYLLLSNGSGSQFAEQRDRAGNMFGFVAKMLIAALIVGGIVVAAMVGLTMLAYQPTPPAIKSSVRVDEGPSPYLSMAERIEHGEVRSVEGWALWNKQQFNAAEAKFQEAVELDAESASAWNGLGWSQFNTGQTREAGHSFDEAIALEPNHPGALNGMGQVILDLGDLDKAKEYLLKAAPQAPVAAFGLGRIYLLQGEFDEAAKWLSKALASDQPDNPQLKKMLAAAKSKELPDELRRQLEPRGRPDGADASQLAAQGWKQFNEGKLRQAEIDFRRALEKDSGNAEALSGLGFCLLANGNWREAKTHFENSLQLAPAGIGAKNGLARCLKAEGKVDEAIAMWEEIHKEFPGATAATAGLATTYLERGAHAKAVPLFEELLVAMPDNAQIREGLAAARKGLAEAAK